MKHSGALFSRTGRRVAVLCLLALAGGLIAAGCDGAFERGSSTATISTSVSLAFEDGSTEATVTEGDVSQLDLVIPPVGFGRLVSKSTLELDPSRMTITTNVDLGDPNQGGFAAGSDLATFLAQSSQITVTQQPDSTYEVAVKLDSANPFAFPVGRMLWFVTVRDDIDRTYGPFDVGLTIISLDLPTAVVTLEIPPVDRVITGLSLPVDDQGFPFVGDQLPFALVVRAIPNAQSSVGFSKMIAGGVADPTRLIVTANEDLGDPANGGIAAGTNLASMFGVDLDIIVDDVTGEVLIGALFLMDAAISPPHGRTRFMAVVVDDGDVSSDQQSNTLKSVTRITLSEDIQKIFSPKCASASCHDSSAPAQGLDLSEGSAWDETVNVRASQTPDDSCATLLVAPYSGDGSYLLHKVKGTHQGGCVDGSGVRMPKGDPALNETQIGKIESWILQGAQNN